MVKCLKLTYSIDEYISSKFTSTADSPGEIYLFSLPAKDDKGNIYTLEVQQNGILPVGTSVSKQVSYYTISKNDNPNKVIANPVFSIPTTSSTGIFLPGTYCSPDGSKLVVNETNTRILTVKII